MSATHFASMLAEEVPAVAELAVDNPFDARRVATVDQVGEAGVEAALRTAYSLFRARDAWLPAHERIAILRRAAELMSAQAEELARVAAAEGGKPLRDSRVEVARAIDGVRNCAELPRAEGGREIPMGVTAAATGRMAFTSHEPIGPVVAVSAFNHPLNLIVHQVGPAVAAGCPVVVKPAEDTPLSCLRFIALLREAGLPAGWAQALLTDSIETAEGLVTDSRVAFFSFIGSARVGWHLRSRLAPGTRCALEHGGAAPVILDRDPDLSWVVPLLAKGGFYHAGQVCVSVQRVFAHKDDVESLARALADSAGIQKVGDPLDEGTDVGPLIRRAEVRRVHQWVEKAVAAGAKLHAGGAPDGETCYRPTVLVDPPDDVEVSRLEIFGPVICVYPFEDVDEAIGRANALPFAFQAAVFSRNLDFALNAAKRLEASAVMINDHTAFRVDWMPFSGLRQSGLGTGGIPHTFRDMRVEKMLVLNSPGP